jgi:putative two-component system response regulator
MSKENEERKKILLVDDDVIQHTIVGNMLNDEYDLIKAKSGDEALSHLYNSKFIPDLILLDIFMPHMDGWEVFNRIKAISLLKNVPIAFFTSIKGEEDEKRAYDIGADDFIKKPFEKEDFLKRIKKIIEKAEKQE